MTSLISTPSTWWNHRSWRRTPKVVHARDCGALRGFSTESDPEPSISAVAETIESAAARLDRGLYREPSAAGWRVAGLRAGSRRWSRWGASPRDSDTAV